MRRGDAGYARLGPQPVPRVYEVSCETARCFGCGSGTRPGARGVLRLGWHHVADQPAHHDLHVDHAADDSDSDADADPDSDSDPDRDPHRDPHRDADPDGDGDEYADDRHGDDRRATATAAPQPEPTSSGLPAWAWVVLVILLLALIGLIAWLIQRTRVRAAWDARLDATRQTAGWVEDSLVPQTMSKATAEEAAATWRSAGPRLLAVDQELHDLTTNAPDVERGDAAQQLRGRLSAVVAAVGADTSTTAEMGAERDAGPASDDPERADRAAELPGRDQHPSLSRRREPATTGDASATTPVTAGSRSATCSSASTQASTSRQMSSTQLRIPCWSAGTVAGVGDPPVDRHRLVHHRDRLPDVDGADEPVEAGVHEDDDIEVGPGGQRRDAVSAGLSGATGTVQRLLENRLGKTSSLQLAKYLPIGS